MGSETSERQRAVVIIPARLAATRLPNKPLLDICGKSMIQRVWDQARMANGIAEVAIATPDEEIAVEVERFGGRAIITSHSHRSGTDRLAEAVEQMHADVVVNVQGDEPLIQPEYIERALQPLAADSTLMMTSLMCPCPIDELDNPATVKVVAAVNGDALYFSRARIPHRRTDAAPAVVMQHIGLYAYRREFLLRFPSLEPTQLEQTEMLEQLRALEHGYRIRMVEVENAPLSVDTEEDLRRVREILSGRTL